MSLDPILARKTDVDDVVSDLDAHKEDVSNAHEASAISFSPDGSLSSTNVQDAIVELRDEAGGRGSVAAEDVTVDSTTLVGTGTDAQAVFEELDNAIADHIADTSAAHAASAISYAGGTGMSATDVEAAIDELATEKANAASLGSLASLSAVSSSEITDGTIVNADINAAAAIAETKLAKFYALRQSATATGSGDQNLFTLAIPAGTLGSTKGLRCIFKCRRTTGSGQVTCKPKFGGTALTSSGALAGPDFYIEVLLWGDGGTSAQRWDFRVFAGGSTLSRSAGTAAVNQTSSQNLTFDIALATTTDVVTLDWASVEYMG